MRRRELLLWGAVVSLSPWRACAEQATPPAEEEPVPRDLSLRRLERGWELRFDPRLHNRVVDTLRDAQWPEWRDHPCHTEYELAWGKLRDRLVPCEQRRVVAGQLLLADGPRTGEMLQAVTDMLAGRRPSPSPVAPSPSREAYSVPQRRRTPFR